MVFTLVACGGASSPATAAELPTYDFVWAHPFPASHHHNVDIIMPLVEELREKSGGRINIEIVPGGAITTGQSAVDDVTSGAVDIVWNLQGSTPGRFPLTDMLEFPGMFESSEHTTQVIWDLFEQSEAFRQEYGDYKVFCMYTADMGDLHNNLRPVRRPEDVAGLNLRAASPTVERTMIAYGANTINMPMPETYDNIDKGVVNGLSTGFSAIPTYRLYEVIKYSTHGLNLYASPQFYAMSLNAWNSLHPEDQALFDSLTGREYSLKAGRYYDNLNVPAVATSRERGVEVYELTDDDLAAFREKSDPMVNQFISEMNGRGYDGQGFYDLIVSLAENRRP